MQRLPIDHNRDGSQIHDNTLQQLACDFWRDGAGECLPCLKDTMQLLDACWLMGMVWLAAIAMESIWLVSTMISMIAVLHMPCEPVDARSKFRDQPADQARG